MKVILLKLYVFFNNPMDYVELTIDALFTWFFRLNFKFYNKSNRLFSRKIAAIGHNASG